MRSDLKSAFRQIRRNPGFAAAVILTLGLGVGAVTAVLTLADPMFFRPLPFPQADRIFTVGTRDGNTFLHGPDGIRAEKEHRGFSAVGFFRIEDTGRLGPSQDDESISDEVTAGLLTALGVQPIIGRSFRPEEYVPRGQARVGLMSYGLWRSAFAGRPDVIGQHVTFSGPYGHSYEIVGVLPREFFLPDLGNEQPAVLVPGAIDPKEIRPNSVLRPVVRLRDGVSAGAATAEMQAIVTNVERDFPRFEQGRRVKMTPLREALFGDVRMPVSMVLAATLCVLLLASANLTHLVMARLRARRREIGVRLAIGASGIRIARQLCVEVFVLAVAGGGAALATGALLSRLAMAEMPPMLRTYQLMPATLDWRVAGLAMALVAAATLAAGIVPALRASTGDVRATLQPGAAANGSRRDVRSGAVLIFGQAATGITLLVCGLLIVRSFETLVTRPLGMAPGRVRTIGLEMPIGTTDAVSEQIKRRVYEALVPRMPMALVRGIPGATLNTALTRPDGDVKRSFVLAWPVSGTFFDVFGLHLVRGRLFTDREAFSNAPVVVLDRRAAELLWPNADPLGRSVKEFDGTLRTVIGLVQTVRSDLLGTGFQEGGAFIPFNSALGFSSLEYRVDGAQVPLASVSAAVSAIAPGIRVSTQPLAIFERQLAQPRFLALLLGALGSLAMVLTVLGVLGVVTHEVAQRTKEIGIRLALGADAENIRRLVLRGALVPAVLGGVLGLSASLWFTESLRSLLYGLDPYDPAIFLAALVAMLLTVALGSLAPAWHASRTDPMTSLRAE